MNVGLESGLPGQVDRCGPRNGALGHGISRVLDYLLVFDRREPRRFLCNPLLELLGERHVRTARRKNSDDHADQGPRTTPLIAPPSPDPPAFKKT